MEIFFKVLQNAVMYQKNIPKLWPRVENVSFFFKFILFTIDKSPKNPVLKIL